MEAAFSVEVKMRKPRPVNVRNVHMCMCELVNAPSRKQLYVHMSF